jgi:hypothetical protein
LLKHAENRKNTPRSRWSTDWKEFRRGLLKPGRKYGRSHPNCQNPVMQESQSIRSNYSKEHGHNWPFTQSIWKCSCGRVNKKQSKQPRKLQEQMEKIVLEGNNARATLHKRTTECTKIFREVSDWMGIIARCNQTLEDVH